MAKLCGLGNCSNPETDRGTYGHCHYVVRKNTIYGLFRIVRSREVSIHQGGLQ